LDILHAARDEVINAQDAMTLEQETLAKVGTDKSGPASHNSAFLSGFLPHISPFPNF
jgi:hypothetical protein